MNKKKHIAQKIRTQEDRKHNVPIFTTENWDKRKRAIAQRVQNKIAKIHKRKAIRLLKII